MKTKIGLSIILISAFYLLLSPTYAQDTQLGNINLNFCNNGDITKELDLIGKAGEQVNICLNLENTDPNETKINIDFLDAIMTQDGTGSKLRACNAADRPKEHFGNFILDYDRELIIPGNSTIQKTYKIKLPVGFKGLSHGCVAYNLVKENTAGGGAVLNIVVRKINFIDIFVGETQVKSQIKIGSIQTIKSGNTTNISLSLKNIGNTSQSVTISGILSNIFGFKEVLKLAKNTFEIPPNQEIQIQTNNEDLILPVYKGFFNVNFDITNKPIFDFNIKENGNIPEGVILGGNFNISKIIFLFNPYFTIVILIFLVLLYLAFFRKKSYKNKKQHSIH